MSRSAISVEHLSKAYRIGLQEEIPDSLVAAASGWVRSPLRNLRRLRRLNTFDGNGHNADDILWALKDVSFEVPEGEVLGVIGRNGAGKSTLLKILSRITEPTSGRAVIRGRVASLLEVGTGFHDELTGRENVYMNATILGMTKREIDRRFDEIVDFSGVEKFLDTPVKRYSSGMKVRLAFAVAAHLEPEILIIDEVLAVGDAEFQKKCLGKMHDVAGAGRTVLFVSHNMGAVSELCTHGIWLQKGSVREEGPTNSVLEKYLRSLTTSSSSNVYVARNASSDIPVTLLRAEVRASDFRTTPRVRFHEPFSFYTEWCHRTTVGGLSYSIRVYDSRSRLVFATNTIGEHSIHPELPGINRVVCEVVPNVLVPGSYSVSIGAFVRPYGPLIDLQHCLSFTVDEIPDVDKQPFRAAGDPVVAPPVKWQRCAA